MSAFPLSRNRRRSSYGGGDAERRRPTCRPTLETLEDRNLLSAGALDAAFGAGGLVRTDFGGGEQVRAAAVQPDDKIVVVGSTNQGAAFALARYQANGSLDASFGNNGRVVTPFGSSNAAATDVTIQPDGRIVVVGHAILGSEAGLVVVRYNANGTLDSGFGANGVATPALGRLLFVGESVALQPSGKIVIGYTLSLSAGPSPRLARLNTNGSLDHGGTGDAAPGDRFGADGTTGFERSIGPGVNDLAIDHLGRIVAVGAGLEVNGRDVARFTVNGAPDTTFGVLGYANTGFQVGGATYSVDIQADHRIVVAAGKATTMAVARFLVGSGADGTLDPNFGTITVGFPGRGVVDASSVRVQSDGKILVAGFAAQTSGSSSYDFALLRLQGNGQVDPDFGVDGRVTTNLTGSFDLGRSVVVQSTGRIIVAGTAANGSAAADFGVVGYDGGPGGSPPPPPPPDTDSDGVPDPVEDAAPNSGDGNRDGIPDSQQDHVASLPNAINGRYVALAAPAGTRLRDVRALALTPPAGLRLPVGAYAYTVEGITTPDGSAEVTMFLPAGLTIDRFYKYGPTADNPQDHWYDFARDASGTGAESFDGPDGFTDRIVLRFIDGGPGDADLVRDGKIVDPGAPAVVAEFSGRLLQVFEPRPTPFSRQFGFAVAAVGNEVLVGDPLEASLVRLVFPQGSQPPRVELVNMDGIGGAYLFSSASGELLNRYSAYDDLPQLEITIDNPFDFLILNQYAKQARTAFGSSLATFGGKIVIGAPFRSLTPATIGENVDKQNAGQVYLFDAEGNRIGNVFPETFPLVQQTQSSMFRGTSLAAWTDGVAIGAPGANSVFLISPASPLPLDPYAVSSSTFGEALATQVKPGGDLNVIFVGAPDGGGVTAITSHVTPAEPHFSSTTSGDSFGSALAARGGRLAVSAPGAAVGSAFGAGIVHLFDTPSNILPNSWSPSPRRTFLNPTPDADDNFGFAVALVGDYVVIGAPHDDTNGPSAGAVYVFHAESGLLLETFLGEAGDRFGFSLAAMGDDKIIVGAPDAGYPDPGLENVGKAYLFDISQPDTDGDGIPDAVEESLAPGSGTQPNIDVLLSPIDGSLITLVAPEGTQLIDVQISAAPPAGAPTPPVGFPLGFFSFTIEGVEPGGAVTVEMISHGSNAERTYFGLLPPINSYYKYDLVQESWYDFAFDGASGAHFPIDGNRLLLTFVDGGRGDADGLADGRIVDPGGPALFLPPPTVQSVVINDGNRQRSRVNSITVTFTGVVALDPGAFELLGRGAGRKWSVPIDVTLATIDSRTVATLTFRRPGTEHASLRDGKYRLVIRAGRIQQVLGHGLDGDGDGVVGGNAITAFFRRFGDSDGDDDVDRRDVRRFAKSFGSRAGRPAYRWFFDANGDGRIDNRDRRRL